MYKLPHFTEDDRKEILSFLRARPFALITGSGVDGKPVATQVPVLIDEEDDQLILTGHVMRSTDHWYGFSKNSDVLAVFSGPNCAVSASWYTNPESGGTWNYMAVHARGTILMLEQDALIQVLTRLTAQVENDPNSGANYVDLPDKYTSKMLPAIQAFEIRITHLDAIFKLSQNRDEAGYDNVIRKLSERGGSSAEIADIMANRRSKVFPTSNSQRPAKASAFQQTEAPATSS
ncbi:MAG: FMN-binding negative transcriptional regulator [Armatimonadota bacterium]